MRLVLLPDDTGTTTTHVSLTRSQASQQSTKPKQALTHHIVSSSMVQNGFDFVVIRCYQSLGMVDPNCIGTLQVCHPLLLTASLDQLHTHDAHCRLRGRVA